MTARVLLTEGEWQWWFGVELAEAARLVRVQRALASAGVDSCPETVLGMSRTVLADGLASQRLRALAELWDRAPAAPVDADPGWPISEEAVVLPDEFHLHGGGALRPYCRRGRGEGRGR